jgi:hypothetical protein
MQVEVETWRQKRWWLAAQADSSGARGQQANASCPQDSTGGCWQTRRRVGGSALLGAFGIVRRMAKRGKL